MSSTPFRFLRFRFVLFFSKCSLRTTAIFGERKSVAYHSDVHTVCLLCTQDIHDAVAALANVLCAPSPHTVCFCVSFVTRLLCGEHAQNNEKTFYRTLSRLQWSILCVRSLCGVWALACKAVRSVLCMFWWRKVILCLLFWCCWCTNMLIQSHLTPPLPLFQMRMMFVYVPGVCRGVRSRSFVCLMQV
jgi:hypothetical protein